MFQFVGFIVIMYLASVGFAQVLRRILRWKKIIDEHDRFYKNPVEQ